MNSSIRIHQLLHGYKRGHQQLAASISLIQTDSDVVTRLSDLSGTLLSGFTFESYLTMYPLPSAKYYAIALTRPDPSAPRAGCVLTHTLLLDMDEWSRLADPRQLANLLKTSQDSSLSALEYTLKSRPLLRQRRNATPDDDDFVGKYFGEGVRPMIWIDAADPEEKLWAIVDALWAALRRSFSGCTLCLQPRNLQNRAFDLMFAPRSATARFSRFSVDHFVEPLPLSTETWQHEFATQVFGGAPTDAESETLISALDDNPTSIRKVFLFRDLWERSSGKPTAAIGVFDLLESLHAPQATAKLQKTALTNAVASFPSLSSSERLELFSMLLLRMSRVPANGNEFQSSFKDFLEVVMNEVLAEFPDAVLNELERVFPRLDDERGFKAEFINNLALALPEQPALMMAVARRPDIGKELLARCPAAFVKAISGIGAEPLRVQVLDWFDDPSFQQRLVDFRMQMLGELVINFDSALFRKGLGDVHKDEVAPILNLLAETKNPRAQEPAVRDAVIENVVRPFPLLAREWIESTGRRDDLVAEVLSASYSPTASEFQSIVNDQKFSIEFRRWVLAHWIVRNAPHSSRFASELGDLAARDPVILESLLESGSAAIGEKAIQILTPFLKSIPTRREGLVKKIFDCAPANSRLLDVVFRSVITDYLNSGNSTSALDTILDQQSFVEWLTDGRSWRLTGLIRAIPSLPEPCSRGWELVYRLPDSSFGRDLVINCIESLLGTTARTSPVAAITTWTNVIRRVQSIRRGGTFEVDVCGQAVRFAFENPYLPVSQVLVVGFLPLYKYVTEVKRVPSTAAGLFSIWNWDKGSELRESLVENFMKGKWPPGDLALAVSDSTLLRKILKRISRKRGGNAFAHRMYSDLISRKDDRALAIAAPLSNLLKNPDYEEEWD